MEMGMRLLVRATTAPIKQAPPDEIRHHYLEFSTTYHESLPPPSLLHATAHLFPPPSDLKPYANPTWLRSRKLLITWMLCALAAVSSCSPGVYLLSTETYTAEWGVSRTASLSGITVWSCSFALAPMFLAPFSELTGRLPVFMPTGLIFLVSQVAAAVTCSFSGMIFSCMLAGLGSSVFCAMSSGVLVDMYDNEDRNTPMAIFAGGTLFGTGFGPVLSGALVQYLGWGWILYVQIILVGVRVSVMFTTYWEMRGSILLSRKVAVLNRWYDELKRVVLKKAEEEREDGGEEGAEMHMMNVQGEKMVRVR